MKGIIRSYWMLLLTTAVLVTGIFVFTSDILYARNIIQYSDTLSDSGPSEYSNHTIEFIVMTDVSAGGYIDITPPSGFSIISSSTFGVRNVELLVNGSPRTATGSVSLGVDGVTITSGSPGLIRYTLNPTGGLSSGDELELRIGNHTSNARGYSQSYSTSTGTSTISADVEPIQNNSSLGRHDVRIRVYDGGQVADANAIIYMIEKVTVPSLDTTETVPPYRFNGRPTSSVGGTTLNVEISLETNEFSICKFSTTEGVSYNSMPNSMDNEGNSYLPAYGVIHTAIVAVTPDTIQSFYVRCIDDEGNFNTDDYLIIFTVSETPTGTANEDGDVSGDGSGSGNEGTGSGSGSGGTVGDSDGQAPSEGSSSGSGGGSGGGGGGTSGTDNEDDSGGGFELSDNPYPSGDGEVIINGYAFPGSTVVILVDGNAADSTTAGSDGRYSITLEEIARGVYTFGVYAIDNNNVRSSTFSTSFTVTGSRTTSLSNINVMPSILVKPDPVQVGQTLTISGYSIPNADVKIENMKDKVSQSLREFTTRSGSNGAWSITVPTDGFSNGNYKVRASASNGIVSTNFSNYTFYGVGQAATGLSADLNRDGSVNLIDFSILLFWWGGSGGDSDPPADINQDGNVSLTDFSILLFQWTG